MRAHDSLLPTPLALSLDRRCFMTAIATSAAMALAAPLVNGVAAQPSPSPTVPLFDDLLAATLATGVPGVALAVERKGELIYSGAAGLASIESKTAMKPNDVFRIYSITKTFTATIVFQLIDEEVLTPDDTITQWLDDPTVALIPNIAQITIGQMLNHTSGIYDFADDNDSPFWDDAFLGPNADWTKVWTLSELIAYASGANHEPYFTPGEGWYYSNTNYLLLGMIIEQATGTKFGNELQRRILTPLALTDTALANGGDLPSDLVQGYQLLDGELVNVSEINLSWVWSAGGITSTTRDLLRFARATFSGALLSPESFNAMFTMIPTANPDMQFGSGLFQQETANGTLIGMDGGSAGFNSVMMQLPKEEITIVVLVNQSPDNGASETLRDEAIGRTLTR